MGLDMYLYLKKEDYTSSFRETERLYPKELREFEEEIRDRNFASKSIQTYYQVGYWRKANAIHQWFVDNCANGEDNCQDTYVSVEKAQELKKLCEKVIANPEQASELLPTQNGFFFGSTDYDEWYFEDIKYTIKILEKVIKFVLEQEKKDNYLEYYQIIYNASW